MSIDSIDTVLFRRSDSSSCSEESSEVTETASLMKIFCLESRGKLSNSLVAIALTCQSNFAAVCSSTAIVREINRLRLVPEEMWESDASVNVL